MNEFDLVLPAEVDVREVGMRDGLQLEAPPVHPRCRCTVVLVTEARRTSLTELLTG